MGHVGFAELAQRFLDYQSSHMLWECFGTITRWRVSCENRTHLIIGLQTPEEAGHNPASTKGESIVDSGEDLVEMLMHDVGQSISHARVREVTSKMVAQFADAKVAAYDIRAPQGSRALARGNSAER